MKLRFAILVTSLSFVTATARAVPVHRFVAPNGTHFLTSQNDFRPGYRYEGVAFQVIPYGNFPGAVGLFRCAPYGVAAEFISVDYWCEGQARVGMLGWVYSYQAPGTVPLYRCYNRFSGDHLTTKNYPECQYAGYEIEGLQGYSN